MQDGIYRLSQAGSVSGATSVKRFNNFLADYGDYGAVQRIGYLPNLNSSVVFTNIPQTYQDLRLVITARGSRPQTTDDILIRYNNDGSTTNGWTVLQGDGASSTSYRNSGGNNFYVAGNMPSANATTGMQASTAIDIFGYSNTSTYKTAICRNSCDLNGSGFVQATVSVYRSTSAVTRIDITQYGGYSLGTAALYGIRASNS